jgi:hypothetical protein
MTRDAAKSASKIVAAANTNFNLRKFRVGQQFVTRLLLFLTVSFFFSTLPSTIVYAFWHSEVTKLSHGRIILNLLNTLQFFRHSSNWIIYVYSSAFMREEMKKCIACTDTEYELAAQAALGAGGGNGGQRPRPTVELLRELERRANYRKATNALSVDTSANNDDELGYEFDEDLNSNLDSAGINTSALDPDMLNSIFSDDPDLYYYYLYYYGKQIKTGPLNKASMRKPLADKRIDEDDEDKEENEEVQQGEDRNEYSGGEDQPVEQNIKKITVNPKE